MPKIHRARKMTISAANAKLQTYRKPDQTACAELTMWTTDCRHYTEYTLYLANEVAISSQESFEDAFEQLDAKLLR
jgi:hypothetical protein